MSLTRAGELIPDLVPDLAGEQTVREVTCQECEATFEPDASWRCSCGASVKYGMERGRCPDCAEPTMFRRQFHHRDCMCLCKVDETRKAEFERRTQERHARERVELMNSQRRFELEQAMIQCRANWWRTMQVECGEENRTHDECAVCPLQGRGKGAK